MILNFNYVSAIDTLKCLANYPGEELAFEPNKNSLYKDKKACGL